jgi:AcrR family transcriptional regulator
MGVTQKPEGRHHHGALRAALLQAVADILGEAGPEAVSLRECARRAGVSHSAAAPHFGDKRGLLTAFAADGSRRLAAAIQAALDALPPAAGAAASLAATGHGYIAFATAHPAHFRLMFRTDLLDRTDPVWQAAMRQSFGLLEGAMAALVPDAGDDAMRARLALAWTAVHGFCALRAEGAGGDLWHPEDRAAATARDMIDLLVAACAAPKAGAAPD